jgi:hypothetical protein
MSSLFLNMESNNQQIDWIATEASERRGAQGSRFVFPSSVLRLDLRDVCPLVRIFIILLFAVPS